MKAFYHGQPSSGIARWLLLSECLGISSELVNVPPGGLTAVVSEALLEEGAAILFDSESLKKYEDRNQVAELAAILKPVTVSVLLLVTGRGEGVDWLLKGLTGGAVVRVVAPPGCVDRIAFPSSGAAFSRELSGFSFPREPEEALGLHLTFADSAGPIMSVGGTPSFVHLQLGRAQVFVWATSEVFDVERPLAAEREFECSADRYIPAIIFLRSALGDRCWHNPCIGAGLIIDDPLLWKSYGFIDFRRLLASARRHAYHVTVAFIPWNYWRTSALQARLFVEYSDCISLCFHGCDHTNREYESEDYEDLLKRNFTASYRMKRHEERTGLACAPLMVCPQELYSSEAIRSFADCRQFLALVCTACSPRNLSVPQLRGADLLYPVQDSFFGVPVFKRYYWSNISAFAMAVFLGKPALLVEHHGFFRHGPGRAEEFVREMTRVCPGVSWRSLTATVRATHLRRRLSESHYEIRFFTDECEIEGERERAVTYDFVRRLPNATSIKAVTVNGVETPFRHSDGWLSLTAVGGLAQTLTVQVKTDVVGPKGSMSRGLGYHAAVAVRRALSEIRDNVISKSDLALQVAETVARRLKLTGTISGTDTRSNSANKHRP